MARQYTDSELSQVSSAMSRFNGDWNQFTAWKQQFEQARGIDVDHVVTGSQEWMRMQPKYTPRDYTRRQPVQAQATGKVMAARFASTCNECGQPINEGDEIWYDFTSRRAHHSPFCPPTPEIDLGSFQAEPVSQPPATPASTLRDGTYTVVMAGARRTLKVHTPKRGNFAGKQIISYLSGSDNESDYTGCAFVNGDRVSMWKRFRGESTLARACELLLNPEAAKAAGLEYAMESGNCYVCSRKLTVPASIYAGIGPICAEKAL
jgi:hypothetical protein